MAISLRKAGKARKRNPAPGWTKSPILWIGGGALVALVGYRIWASKPATPAPAGVTSTTTVNLPPAPSGSRASTMTPAQIQAYLAPYASNPILYGEKYQELYAPA